VVEVQTEVIMTGIGGQGIQLCAKVLALAATNEGRQAMLSAHYGGEMRGGETEASVVVGDTTLRALPILPSTWSAFVMHPNHWPSVRDRLRPDAVVVLNSSIMAAEAEGVDGQVFAIPADAIAASVSAPMGAGFVLLGAYCAITGLVGLDSLVDAMKQLVPPYRTQHVVANEASLRAGAQAAPLGAAPAWTTVPPQNAGAR
jgi:2-oxoglutarate ferredoxin oxidoreductase subunit gamma